MKDTIIISTISKIHSAIISFLSFIFLTLFLGFIVLQNGLYLEDFSVSNISIKKLYLKWDHKLNLYVEHLDISPTSSSAQNSIDKKHLLHYSKSFYHIMNLFDSIVISDFKYKSIEGKLSYKPQEDLKLSLHSKELQLATALAINEKHLLIHIKQFEYDKISVNGDIYLNPFNLNSFSKINLSINNDANLTLYTAANDERIDYKVLSHNKIQDIKTIMHDIPFPKEIHYWIYDAIELENLDIYAINGFLDFNNLSEGFKNIHVVASANKLEYFYNQKLDAVHTDHTDLEFKDGVLCIRPQEAFSYAFDLEKSWLKIDFTKKEELLSLFLNFSPTLDKNILNILKTYKITLPIKQNSGTVKTDLQLVVNLHTIGVDANGTFVSDKGNFHYLGQDFDIENLKLQLNNYDINVQNMSAHYKDMIDAKVDIKYNAKESKGDVKFEITKCKIKDQIQLTKKPLKATYYIDKKQDILSVDSSQWTLKTFQLNVDKIDMPLDINTYKINIPTTYCSLKNTADGFISGNIDLKNLLADLSLDLLNFQYAGIKSTRSNTPFKLEYKDNVFSIKSLDDIYLNIINSDITVSNLTLELKNNNLYIKNPTISFGKFTKTRLYARYDFQKQKAHFSFNDLVIKNPKTPTTIFKKKKVLLSASIKDDGLKIESLESRSSFSVDNEKWSLKLSALENLSRYSDLMKKYHIDNGEIEFYKKLDDNTTRFQGKINYPYKILMHDNQPVKEYNISGRVTKKQNVYIKVNQNVNISVKDDVAITLHNSAVSLPEITKLFSTVDNNESNTSVDVTLKAFNSMIYLGDGRNALYDTFMAQYHNNIFTAQLQHQNGKAGFKLEDQNFHLYGEGFGDQFMEKLFIFSKFKNGTFDFNVDGTLNKYSGVFLIEKSTLMDYRLLNNVLAFINTIPSLITFSIPGYSKNGLFMNHAYLKFDYDHGIYNVNEMYMDSKELKISATGKADVKNDSVDMSMTLKTDIGSDMSKIPLVGYIIFDGKAISTSVKITGKLSDPKIESALAKEVIVAPLNIIKRTLKLPLKLFE
ncbi:AsmA-like C-terminal domain-containing protein [Sulfurimonas sp.]|uniref:YhdP family protein n=1 Tax=Sulfurimonas sp. TaxID=2022749 RepID=UPI003D0CECC9